MTVALVLALVLLVACRAPAPTSVATLPPASSPVAALAIGPTGGPPDPHSVAVPLAGTCHVRNGLPDRDCTPGLLNGELTPSRLCAADFSTRSIRPPVAYTDALKLRLMLAYGQRHEPPQPSDLTPAAVELDHLVALEDLGHPWDARNLWPQPRRSSGVEPNAEEKDQVETRVHALLCSDQSHAELYAARLAGDWTAFRTTSAELAPLPTKEPEP